MVEPVALALLNRMLSRPSKRMSSIDRAPCEERVVPFPYCSFLPFLFLSFSPYDWRGGGSDHRIILPAARLTLPLPASPIWRRRYPARSRMKGTNASSASVQLVPLSVAVFQMGFRVERRRRAAGHFTKSVAPFRPTSSSAHCRVV